MKALNGDSPGWRISFVITLELKPSGKLSVRLLKVRSLAFCILALMNVSAFEGPQPITEFETHCNHLKERGYSCFLSCDAGIPGYGGLYE